MHCSLCGNIIDDDSKFCRYCGVETDYWNSYMFCQHCGEQIENDSRYCKFCGKRITERPEGVKRYGFLLFVDTETTGLPDDINAPVEDYSKWPRLVQLSWILTDLYGNIKHKQDDIIRPDGFIIPEYASRIHGITNEIAKERGIGAFFALDNFFPSIDWRFVVAMIGHNIEFDKKIILSECYRNNYKIAADCGFDDNIEMLSHQKTICTMKESVDYCKIPDRFGDFFRYPKLQELYYKLFGENFENAHNSLADVEATMKCFFELIKKGIIKSPE